MLPIWDLLVVQIVYVIWVSVKAYHLDRYNDDDAASFYRLSLLALLAAGLFLRFDDSIRKYRILFLTIPFSFWIVFSIEPQNMATWKRWAEFWIREKSSFFKIAMSHGALLKYEVEGCSVVERILQEDGLNLVKYLEQNDPDWQNLGDINPERVIWDVISFSFFERVITH